jgi:hypothetical protein
MMERGLLAYGGLHTAHSRREIRVYDVQFDVSGELPGVTVRAQIIRPRDFHRTDRRQHGLGAEFPVMGLMAAITRNGALLGGRRGEA